MADDLISGLANAVKITMEIQNNIYQTVKEIILFSRQRVYRMANSALLETYWQIGKIIVEDEQNGRHKAEYGNATLKNLAQQLTLEFGRGFDYTNLTNMRKFYQAFPILDALRQELSWTFFILFAVDRLCISAPAEVYLNVFQFNFDIQAS